MNSFNMQQIEKAEKHNFKSESKGYVKTVYVGQKCHGMDSILNYYSCRAHASAIIAGFNIFKCRVLPTKRQTKTFNFPKTI